MSAAAPDVPASTDGRELRSIRTRAAIINAWLGLIDAGDLSPTAKGVADRARIGLRTVFQHFSDMDALHQAAAEDRLSRVMADAVTIDADSPLPDRIVQIIDSRSRIYEKLTPLRRASERQEWVSPGVRELIEKWERVGSASAHRIFAPELTSMTKEDRENVGAAIDAAVCWSNWNQLRHRRSLSAAKSRAVVSTTLRKLLA